MGNSLQVMQLQSAVERGDLERVRLLLECSQSERLLNARDRWNNTPLHAAAFYGHVAVVEHLLQCKAPVDATNELQNTPLHIAALHYHVEVAEVLLVQGGATVDCRNGKLETPLHFAALTGAGHMAALLLHHKAAVDSTDIEGNTPLHKTAGCVRERTAVAELLLQHGADARALNNQQQTALTLAQQQGRQGVVELLQGVQQQ